MGTVPPPCWLSSTDVAVGAAEWCLSFVFSSDVSSGPFFGDEFVSLVPLPYMAFLCLTL